MDKQMLYQDLLDSAAGDKSFTKAITSFTDRERDDYLETLEQIEKEGKIILAECKIQETGWGKLILAKGYIQ